MTIFSKETHCVNAFENEAVVLLDGSLSIALNEYHQDRADRADRKREKKKDRIHDFVLAALSALFGVLGTLLVQLLLGVI